MHALKKAIFLVVATVLSISKPVILVAGDGYTDSALHAKAAQWMNNAAGLRFLENKGQMMDMQRKPVPNVLYEASSNGMSQRDPFGDVYVTTSGLSYVFVKLEKHPKGSLWDKKKNSSTIHFPNGSLPGKEHNDSITETYCRADMQLIGANIKKENIVQKDASTDRSNYYYGDICPNGILGVRSYSKVTIKNIYPGIDWVLHSGTNGLKYDFIVHPGADPSMIKLKYKWTNKPQLQDDGSINISTPMGTITEGIPASYCKGERVQTTYSIQDSEIHFAISNYNASDTLIIDPQLVWATYYAGHGNSNQFGEDLSDMQDDGTNVWLTGIVNYTNFPTLNPGGGAYFEDTLLASVANLFILQFNTAGVLEWATYYGGNNYDIAWSIYSNGSHVWIAGQTNSPDFPTYNPGGGAYYQSKLGSANAKNNAFILQFSTAGIRQWATYFGGSTLDVGMAIHSSGKNIWVTGYTGSANFPTLNPGGGAYFQGSLAGIFNAFILQFDSTQALTWATYYGGSNQSQGDEGLSISSNTTNVWVTGCAASTNFPTYNPGGGAYFQATPGTNTGTNAFVLQFSNTGIRKWATCLGGNANTRYQEQGNSIYADSTSIWVTGPTSSTNFPTLNPGGGAYFQAGSTSNQNVFISQFNHSGALTWSTYYGGSGEDDAYSVQSDGSNIWVCGATTSPDFPIHRANCGYYDSTIGKPGNQDVFILEFSTGGSPQWATYYGTDQENDDSYAWSDGTNLFVAGDATQNGYPTKNPGGGAYFWDSTVTYPSENIFIGKFIVSGHGASPNASICKGDTTRLTANGGISYSWSPATGLSATNIPNPVASPTVTTTYTVTIVDTGACGGTFKDSVKVTVDTLNLKNIRISDDTTVCAGNSVTLTASGGPDYSWSTGATTSSITIAKDTATTTYTVKVSNGGCAKDTSVTVTVTSVLNGAINGNLSICTGHSTTLTATGGTSYQWSNGSTTSSITVSPSSTTSYSVVISQGGCTGSASASVSVNIASSITACCNTSIEPGQTVQLNVTGAGNGYSYSWAPPTGLNCTACSNPVATPEHTTTYTVVAINDSNGCASLSYVTIDVSCGNVFVPDAFSPNAAYNNILYVRGNCIAGILFEIFDRWGNQIYESVSTDDGWDGKWKGKPMNMDTYVWLLKATMKDGTHIDKSGNVTLIK